MGSWDVEFGKLKHRVIGIRLEGIDRLGYIFCEAECDSEDEGDVENYELFFYDVILAPRWIKFRRYLDQTQAEHQTRFASHFP